MGMWDFLKWTLRHFSTREHFVRAIATAIIAVALWEVIVAGKIEDTMLLLVGNVMGFYFKGHSERDPDEQDGSVQVGDGRDTTALSKKP